jgi:UDP-3-O-[3-hydroxymyristoyl] glucosamine N-acyltransferase
MSTRLGDLVESLGGELIGDPAISITGIAPLEAASASHITFLSNPRLRSGAAKTRAAALILSAKDFSEIGGAYTGAVVLTDNPYAYYARVAQLFAERSAPPPEPGIHPSAVIDASAKIAATAVIGPNVTIDAGAVVGERCIIGAGCVIGKSASLGEGTVLHPNVSFLADCHIGARGVIQSGAVIGGDGFGFANDKGRWLKIPQTGGVRLGDDVEIGANTTIDRGAQLCDRRKHGDGRLRGRRGQRQDRTQLHIRRRCDGFRTPEHCRQCTHFLWKPGVALDCRTRTVHRLLPAGKKRRLGKDRGCGAAA